MNTSLVKTVCSAVAVGMGVAVLVTSIVAPLSTASATIFLGIGVAALGIAGLQK